MLFLRVNIFCLLFLLLTQTANAQTGAISDPTGRFWMGANVGGTFHKSDVKSQLGYGWGLTMEYFIWKRYFAPFALSTRLRYLGAEIYGKDDQLSYNTQYNAALNGTNDLETDYNSGNEPVIHNFLTESHNLGLEMVLYLNALRKMNINFYLFGGADVMWYKSSVDQLDEDGNRYDYANMDLTKLSTEMDGIYETNAEGNEGSFSTAFAPTFGAGLGYIFNHRWSIGLEHKVTFPNTDRLDGQQWTVNNSPTGVNDIFHYTSFILGVGFGGTGVAVNETKTATPTPAPAIHMVWPSNNNYHSASCDMNIVANLFHVKRKEQISVYQNDIQLSAIAYRYDEATGRLEVQTSINEPTRFVISANNGAGKAEQVLNITCSKSQTVVPPVNPVTPVPEPTVPKMIAPYIQIELPVQKSVTTSDCQANIMAYLANTNAKSWITVKENGTPLPQHGFYFNATNKKLTINKSFSGKAIYTIEVNNGETIVWEQVTYTCVPAVVPTPVTGKKPEIIVLKPTDNPYRTLECEAEVMAEVLNVSEKEQINVRLNGTLLAPSTYNFDPGTSVLSLRHPIQKFTRLAISASNKFGEDEEVIRMECEPPVYQPPVTVVTKPFISMKSAHTNPAFVNDCNANFQLSVFGIERKSAINISLNGKALSPAFYSYDQAQKTVSINTPIEETANFVVVATNEGGTTSYTQTFNCKKEPPVVKPIINIVQPTTQVVDVKNCTIELDASITGIAGKDQLMLRENGVIIPKHLYSYNAVSKELSMSKTFEGTSKIEIITQNVAGIVTAQRVFNCIKATPVPPIAVIEKPEINLAQPLNESFASATCNERFYGTITNVDKKDQVTVRVNGTPVDFFYNDMTKRFNMELPIKGVMQVELTAQNKAGKAYRKFVITCEEKVPAPSVKILSPTNNPHVVQDCKAKVLAQTSNVERRDQIDVTENGKLVHFDFDANSGIITVENTINEGIYAYVIDVKTAGGADVARTSITCVKPTPVVPKPEVVIISPLEQNAEVANCQLSLTASVLHVEKVNMQVLVDGKKVPFTFDETTKLLTVSQAFAEKAVVEVRANNGSGSKSVNRTFVCTPKVEVPAPKIAFITPNTNPYQTTNCNFEVKASVQHVASKNDVKILVNGVPVNFEYHTTTNVIEFPLESSGEANITIVATNEKGEQTATQKVLCTPPAKKPTLALVSPATSPFVTEDCAATIKVKATEVTQKSQLNVTVAGKAVDFGFNPSNGMITINRTFTGQETVVISASNEGGEASVAQVLKCQIAAPQITVISPATTPFETETCRAQLKAQIDGKVTKNDIKLFVGSKETPLFSFINGTLTYDVDPFERNQFVEIIAGNEGGQDKKIVEFVCMKEDKKISICHYPPGNRDNPQTIEIAESAWSAHAGHGDVKGACPVLPKPVINITDPSGPIAETTNCRATLFGKIDHVRERKNVQVTMNGSPYYAFKFDNGNISINNEAFKGDAVFEITATNGSGTAKATKTFKCIDQKISICHIPPGNKDNPQTITIAESAWPAHEAHGDTKGACPVQQKPVISINQPGQDVIETSDCKATLRGKVDNVQEAKNITVTLNGAPFKNYTFSNGNIAINNYAFDGEAKFIITANNGAGQTSITKTFKCEKKIGICHYPPGNRDNPQNITISENAWPAHERHGDTRGACPVMQKPVINIQQPGNHQSRVTGCDIDVRARTYHILEKGSIDVTIDGKPQNFAWDGSNITFNKKVQPGPHTVLIKATNATGTAQQQFTYTCPDAKPAPNEGGQGQPEKEKGNGGNPGNENKGGGKK